MARNRSKEEGDGIAYKLAGEALVVVYPLKEWLKDTAFIFQSLETLVRFFPYQSESDRFEIFDHFFCGESELIESVFIE